ncbi:AP2-3 [Scenedesmus sp. PABB004]|nr:AP2-3 [Scenedesmus sp. PABB004]
MVSIKLEDGSLEQPMAYGHALAAGGGAAGGHGSPERRKRPADAAPGDWAAPWQGGQLAATDYAGHYWPAYAPGSDAGWPLTPAPQGFTPDAAWGASPPPGKRPARATAGKHSRRGDGDDGELCAPSPPPKPRPKSAPGGGPPAGAPGGARGNRASCTSQYKGVCWNRKNMRWQTAINVAGRYLYLGSYNEEAEAARAYDRAALKIRGPDTHLNFDAAGYVGPDGEVLLDDHTAALILKHWGPTTTRAAHRRPPPGKPSGRQSAPPGAYAGAARAATPHPASPSLGGLERPSPAMLAAQPLELGASMFAAAGGGAGAALDAAAATAAQPQHTSFAAAAAALGLGLGLQSMPWALPDYEPRAAAPRAHSAGAQLPPLAAAPLGVEPAEPGQAPALGLGVGQGLSLGGSLDWVSEEEALRLLEDGPLDGELTPHVPPFRPTDQAPGWLLQGAGLGLGQAGGAHDWSAAAPAAQAGWLPAGDPAFARLQAAHGAAPSPASDASAAWAQHAGAAPPAASPSPSPTRERSAPRSGGSAAAAASGGGSGGAPVHVDLREVMRRLPDGCTLEQLVVGGGGQVGALYRAAEAPGGAAAGPWAAALWDGAAWRAWGDHATAADARAACAAAMAGAAAAESDADCSSG